MGGHLPLAAILDVDLERENAVWLLVVKLHADEAAQYGGLAIYADLRLAVGERLIMAALQDGVYILRLRLGFAVGMRVAEIVRQKALQSGHILLNSRLSPAGRGLADTVGGVGGECGGGNRQEKHRHSRHVAPCWRFGPDHP